MIEIDLLLLPSIINVLFEIKSNPADHKATGEVMVPKYNAEEYF